MKKNTFGIIMATIAIILTISNPPLDDHKSVVRQKVFYPLGSKKIKIPADSLSESSGTASDSTSAITLTEELLDVAISRDSYVFFSLTRATFNDNSRIIGVGFMGNVYITKEIDPNI